MARIGEVIDGKYEILREIGRGGMSVVYLAMDKRLNKQWAIKEFRKDNDNRQIALKALLDEANLIKKLDHPTLPRIVDIIDNGYTIYIVMDYIEGESLNKILDAYGAQPVEAVIEWGKQLSDVLDYLHTLTPPVIYRDMKPANIMLRPDGTVKLIDFGIAREYKEGKAGDTSNIGTRGYAAPEQFVEQGQTDARTDIYSLGVTLYHLVTGKNPAEPPYELIPIRNLNPSLPSGLEWLIQKCTQLNPKDRYQSCAEVTYVLNNLDKFEVAYKTKLRTKLNLFIASIVMTVVFAAVGTIGLLTYINNNTKLYDSYISAATVESYKQAIDLNDKRPEAYIDLATLYKDQRPKITDSQGKSTKTNEETKSQISAYFSPDRLEMLKTVNLEDYLDVNYHLGFIYMLNYKYIASPDEEAPTLVKYYGNIVSAYSPDPNSDFTQKEYTLSKLFFIISTFEFNRTSMDIDNEITVNETFVSMFKDQSKFTKNKNSDMYTVIDPFRLYWDQNVELSNTLKNDTKMAVYYKLDILQRLTYTLKENIPNFKSASDGVTVQEMVSMFNQLNTSANGISESSKQDVINFKKNIRDCLISAKNNIEASYKNELNINKNLKLGDVN